MIADPYQSPPLTEEHPNLRSIWDRVFDGIIVLVLTAHFPFMEFMMTGSAFVTLTAISLVVTISLLSNGLCE